MLERLTRAQRRQILKDDEPWIGKAIDFKAVGRGAQANTRHMAITLLDTGLSRRASRAAAFAGELLDATIASQVLEPVACGKGCDHCCKTYVSATIPEILRLARAIRAKQATRDRLAEAAARCKAISQEQRKAEHITCPILADHACSEYPDRPLVCRTVLSTSLPACLRIFGQNAPERFPHAENTVNIRTYFVIMLQAALILSELPHRHYELNHALALALAEENAEERWLAGEPVFADVAIDTSDVDASPLDNLVQKLVATVRPTI